MDEVKRTVYTVNQNHKVVATPLTVHADNLVNDRGWANKTKLMPLLNQEFQKSHPNKQLEEISSTNKTSWGQKASAFNLPYVHDGKTYHVENVFQAGKHFKKSGYIDAALQGRGIDAKRAVDPVKHEGVDGFKLFNQSFPTQPDNFFYNWVYCSALVQPQNREILNHVIQNDSFSDVSFLRDVDNHRNNCQAQGCAIVKSLYDTGQLPTAMANPAAFKHAVYDTGLLVESNQSQHTATKSTSTSALKRAQKPTTPTTNVKYPVVEPDYQAKIAMTLAKLPQIENNDVVSIMQAADKRDKAIKSDNPKQRFMWNMNGLQSLHNPKLMKLMDDGILTSKTWLDTAKQTKEDVNKAKRDHISIISLDSPYYPVNAKKAENVDKAPVLYVKGDPRILNNNKSAALVGTRENTPEGDQYAQRTAQHLVKNGYVVTAGLADGTDTIAHKSTIANGGKTIAIVAGGIDVPIYPATHRSGEYHRKNKQTNQWETLQGDGLADDIVKTGGAIVSPYPMGTPYYDRQSKNMGHRMIERDALQTSFSDVVIANETSFNTQQAKINGGTAHAMEAAGKQKRPLIVPDWNQLRGINDDNNFTAVPYKERGTQYAVQFKKAFGITDMDSLDKVLKLGQKQHAQRFENAKFESHYEPAEKSLSDRISTAKDWTQVPLDFSPKKTASVKHDSLRKVVDTTPKKVKSANEVDPFAEDFEDTSADDKVVSADTSTDIPVVDEVKSTMSRPVKKAATKQPDPHQDLLASLETKFSNYSDTNPDMHADLLSSTSDTPTPKSKQSESAHDKLADSIDNKTNHANDNYENDKSDDDEVNMDDDLLSNWK